MTYIELELGPDYPDWLDGQEESDHYAVAVEHWDLLMGGFLCLRVGEDCVYIPPQYVRLMVQEGGHAQVD